MRVISAHVRGGNIVPDEETPLPEGAVVTVLADMDEPRFAVSPEEEAQLLEAMAEADRGQVVPAAEVLRHLSR